MHILTFLLHLVQLSLSLCATTANGDEFNHIECPNNTNYTRGGAFDANLDALISYLLPAAAASSGFATNVTGPTSDQVFGLAQCRADVVVRSACRACLDAALQTVTRKCSGQKTALNFYDNQNNNCVLRYSNTSFFGALDSSWREYVCNGEEAPQQLFVPRLAALMSNLTGMAAYRTPHMFAADAVEATPGVRLYGMAYCTRDLTADNCMACLSDFVDRVKKQCARKIGARMYRPSCYLRYEVYSFYDVQEVEAAMAPARPSNGSELTGPGTKGQQQSTSPADRSDHTNQGSTGSKKRTVRTVLLVSIPVSITLLVLMFVAISLFKNRHVNEEMESLESLRYALSTLRAATDNFSERNKLGQGAFGLVYKGQLQNGQEIAVKKLSKTSKQGQKEMKNEVVLVANLQHKNLVRLLGYCIEKHERLLVYEFLINQSLDKILYGPARQSELSWGQRYNIIYGIGRGLMYLHEDSRLTIIHRDLKPGNMLLDADMNPKISDFGLAKLFNIDPGVANTDRVAGTRGYMAPEYIHNGILSAKSDIFSYGVLVLEIITSRRPYDDLLKFVWTAWSQQDVTSLVDIRPVNEPGEQLEMLRCIQIGLLCVQDDPQLRPTMASVVHMLSSRSMTLAQPTEPVFAATGQRLSMAAPEPSINEASISHVEPR